MSGAPKEQKRASIPFLLAILNLLGLKQAVKQKKKTFCFAFGENGLRFNFTRHSKLHETLRKCNIEKDDVLLGFSTTQPISLPFLRAIWNLMRQKKDNRGSKRAFFFLCSKSERPFHLYTPFLPNETEKKYERARRQTAIARSKFEFPSHLCSPF